MLWVNGTVQSASEALDRGLEFGDGLFETMALINGRVRLLDRHLARLEAGCARLRLACPDHDELMADVNKAAQTPNAGVVKLIVTRGRGGTGYGYAHSLSAHRYVITQPARVRPPEYATHGVRVQWVNTRHGTQPLLAGLKHLNRLEQVLARAELADGCAEGLMLDQGGHLISGTMSNVFAVIHGRLVTPTLTHCGVAGAMRGALIDAWRQADVVLDVRDIFPAELLQASEVFVTNALIGVWPVTQLGDSHWPVGPYATQAQAWIQQW